MPATQAPTLSFASTDTPAQSIKGQAAFNNPAYGTVHAEPGLSEGEYATIGTKFVSEAPPMYSEVTPNSEEPCYQALNELQVEGKGMEKEDLGAKTEVNAGEYQRIDEL